MDGIGGSVFFLHGDAVDGEGDMWVVFEAVWRMFVVGGGRCCIGWWVATQIVLFDNDVNCGPMWFEAGVYSKIDVFFRKGEVAVVVEFSGDAVAFFL